MQVRKIEERHMTTVIECHPPVAEKSAADSRIPNSTTVNGVDTGKLSATTREGSVLMASMVMCLSSIFLTCITSPKGDLGARCGATFAAIPSHSPLPLNDRAA